MANVNQTKRMTYIVKAAHLWKNHMLADSAPPSADWLSHFFNLVTRMPNNRLWHFLHNTYPADSLKFLRKIKSLALLPPGAVPLEEQNFEPGHWYERYPYVTAAIAGLLEIAISNEEYDEWSLDVVNRNPHPGQSGIISFLKYAMIESATFRK